MPAEARSRFWGLMTASLSFGTISAYVLTPPLLEARGWPFVFEAYGGAGVLLAAAWAAWGASTPATDTQQCVVVDGGVVVEACGGEGVLEAPASTGEVPWRAIAASPPVWALAAAHSASNFFMYFGLSWLPTYFSVQFGMSTADASAASLMPYVAGAGGALVAGAACDALVARGVALSDARKGMQAVALLGPAASMLALCALGSGAVSGLPLDRPAAEALFVLGVACQSFCAAGFGCGAQDISMRYSSLIYGATSVVAVACGAAGQVFTGWLLEANGRDFLPMFGLTAAVQLAGLAVFLTCWDSRRAFE